MKLESSVTLFDDNKVEDRFAELQVTADGITAEVGTKVGNNEVISRINQTAESVKIQANKIQIDGVITAINNNTTTTINGGKITTGTLSASAVNANSGTFNTANIPNLSANKIATDTINIARIPATARNDTYITDIGSDGIRVHDSHTPNNSVVINSSGMEVFKGGTAAANSVAKYGDVARIGKPSGTSRIELDYHSMQLIDKEGSTYLHVSDLRNEQGVASVQDNFTGDGSKKTFELSLTPVVSSITAKVNGTTVTAYTITQGSTLLTFTNAPANGATIVITYNTTSITAKVFTFGNRASGNVGAGSISLGDYNIASGNKSVAIGYIAEASGNNSSSIGFSTVASGRTAHAEGERTTASGDASHSEGGGTAASGGCSHAEGSDTVASNYASHAEGNGTTASGIYSHAEGYQTQATKSYCHSEGYKTKAIYNSAHAEGDQTTASENAAHAEGYGAIASGIASHAEGSDTTASGDHSHAEGQDSQATEAWAHAEGYGTTAAGMNSHAGGDHTIANGDAQTAIGKYNVAHSSHLFIVGKGTSSARANAFHITSTGAVYVNGSSVHSSDRRLKEHISYVGDEAVDFINGLKPAHYIKDGEKHVGFYAQDVAEVDKWDCMIGEEMNGYMTLGYMELIAPLVAYVQRLEKRIEELERTNK